MDNNKPIGPTGSLDNSNEIKNKLSAFNSYLLNILNNSSAVIRAYLENESHSILYKEMKLDSSTDVKMNVLSTEHKKYVEAFNKVLTDNNVNNIQQFFLGSFDKILKENDNVFLQAIGNDSWIKSVDQKTGKPLQIMFGDVKDRESVMCSRLGMIYKMSLVLEKKHKEKMEEYPDLFPKDQRDPKLDYPALIIYNCFLIFKLTPTATNSDISSKIDLVIKSFSTKLGIKTDFNINKLLDSSDHFLSMGTNLINRHAGAAAAKEGKQARTLEPNQLKNIFGKLLNGGDLQKVFNSIKDSASKGGPPDIGGIFNDVVNNLNPEKMMNELKKATEEEIPDLVKPPEKDEKNEKLEIVETIETIETIEEDEDEKGETLENETEETVEIIEES